jgi:hypothetical protein
MFELDSYIHHETGVYFQMKVEAMTWRHRWGSEGQYRKSEEAYLMLKKARLRHEKFFTIHLKIFIARSR